MIPGTRFKHRNRRTEESIKKHLDFLLQLKATCLKGKHVGSLQKTIRKWSLSSSSAIAILNLKIVTPIGPIKNGKFQWNGLNGNEDVNLEMVKAIRDEVKRQLSIYLENSVPVVSKPIEAANNILSNELVSKVIKFVTHLPNSLSEKQKEETINNLMRAGLL